MVFVFRGDLKTSHLGQGKSPSLFSAMASLYLLISSSVNFMVLEDWVFRSSLYGLLAYIKLHLRSGEYIKIVRAGHAPMGLFTRGIRFKWGAGIFESRYYPFIMIHSLKNLKRLQGLVTFKYLGSLETKTRMFLNNE